MHRSFAPLRMTSGEGAGGNRDSSPSTSLRVGMTTKGNGNSNVKNKSRSFAALRMTRERDLAHDSQLTTHY
jgi:hypothetical protein